MTRQIKAQSTLPCNWLLFKLGYHIKHFSFCMEILFVSHRKLSSSFVENSACCAYKIVLILH